MPEVLAIATTNEIARIEISEFLSIQEEDRTCNEIAKKFGLANTSFDVNSNGLIIRTSRIDQSKKIVVPLAPQLLVLVLSNQPLLAGLPGGTKMNEKLWRQCCGGIWKYVSTRPYRTAGHTRRSAILWKSHKNHYVCLICPNH